MSFVLTQFIIMTLYKTNSKYNVMKCLTYVVVFYCRTAHHNYYNATYEVCVCVSPYSTLELE